MRVLIVGSEGSVGQLFVKTFNKNQFDLVGIDIVSSQKTSYKFNEINIMSLSEEATYDLVKNFDVIGLCTPTAISISILRKLAAIDLSQKLIFDVSSIKSEIMDAFSMFAPDTEILSLHPMFGPNLPPQGKNLTYVNLNGGNLSRDVLDTLESIGVKCWNVDAKEHDKGCTLTIALNHLISFIVSNAYIWANMSVQKIEPFKTPPHEIYLLMASRVILNGMQTSINIQAEDKNLPNLIEYLIRFLEDYKDALDQHDKAQIQKEFEKVSILLDGKAEELFKNSIDLISHIK